MNLAIVESNAAPDLHGSAWHQGMAGGAPFRGAVAAGNGIPPRYRLFS
jgi:hypothetical protein